MRRLSRLVEMTGNVNITDAKGEKKTFVWDYAKRRARLATDMTYEEIAASERAKWNSIKHQIDVDKK